MECGDGDDQDDRHNNEVSVNFPEIGNLVDNGYNDEDMDLRIETSNIHFPICFNLF